MKNLLRISAMVLIVFAVAFLSTGCSKSTKTVIIESDITVPVTPPTEVLVPDQPAQPPPPPPTPPPSSGTEVLVPDEGDVIIPK